jgi:hypothetical protein
MEWFFIQRIMADLFNHTVAETASQIVNGALHPLGDQKSSIQNRQWRFAPAA